MPTPEAVVKNKINKVLKRYSGGLWYFMPVPGGYGRPTLDYVGALLGKAFAIEAKAPGKLPTDRQQQTIEDMRNAGIMVFLIDGDTTELELWLSQTLLSLR
jgi:hypothetical protein